MWPGLASGWENLLEILTKPDNIPIELMIAAVCMFTWLSLREAVRHERVIKESRRRHLLDAPPRPQRSTTERESPTR